MYNCEEEYNLSLYKINHSFSYWMTLPVSRSGKQIENQDKIDKNKDITLVAAVGFQQR